MPDVRSSDTISDRLWMGWSLQRDHWLSQGSLYILAMDMGDPSSGGPDLFGEVCICS